MRSRLLDRGTATILVFPEVDVINNRGDLLKVPSSVGVPVRVSMSKDRNASAELPGQVDVKIIKCIARAVPAGSWARVEYNGEEWDLAAPPHFGTGVSRNTVGVSFTLRSRNDIRSEGSSDA